MAVYTKLSEQEIRNFLNRYDFGDLISYAGIEEGIENTNYLITTTQNKFILTIFEQRVNVSELPFFIAYTDHLRKNGINCPVTLPDKNGVQLQEINGKKAALISFLQGSGVKKIESFHLAELGAYTAKMHLAASNFKQTKKNDFALSKWTQLFSAIGVRANEVQKGLAKFIADEIYFLAANWPFDLPSGVVHADLFPDNVFFLDEKVSGVIDFYFSANDYFAYDVAICLNAWGAESDEAGKKLFLDAYEKIRPLSQAEKDAMPVLLRGAAVRFLMTRLYDWFYTPEGSLVKKKDPMEYVVKLKKLA